MQDRALRGWLTVKKAAEYCSMSERTVRTWLKQGLKHTRTVFALRRLAARNAPQTKGVVPLAVIPTTASRLVMP